MKTVELKNGSTEMRMLVVGTYLILQKMLDDIQGVTAYYELVQTCIDSKHEIFSDVQKQYLIDKTLMQTEGSVHGSIRNIVLSATIGEGVDLSLVNPIIS